MSIKPKPSEFVDECRASAGETPRPQVAALCYRVVDGRSEILLITSRDTGRWLVPKGWPIDGLAPHEAAAREAFEEAGAEGSVDPASLGVFHYDKRLSPKTAVPCRVWVYPLRVTRLRDDFPEMAQRRRKWFRPRQAANRLQEPELRTLVAAFRGLPTAEGRKVPGHARRD